MPLLFFHFINVTDIRIAKGSGKYSLLIERKAPPSPHQKLPAKNLFGQPSIPASCVVKEIIWEGSNEKSTFFYNSNQQVIKHIETGGDLVTSIEYNNSGQINRITGLEAATEMTFHYDNHGRVDMIDVKNDGRAEKVDVKYQGDKIVQVVYSTFSITFYFDEDYNLTKATTQLKDLSKPVVEAILEVRKDYKNYALSTGDYRFVSLLYGDYIGEAAYALACTNFCSKYTTTDNSTGVSKTESFFPQVQSTNANNYPTTVLYKFSDAKENFRISISYDCK